MTPPKPEEVYSWAHEAMRMQDWEEALKRWSVLRKAYPKQARTWVQSAVALRKLNQLQQAESFLSEAITRFPNNINLHIQLAETLMQADRLPEALTLWQSLTEQFPAEMLPWVRLSDCHLLLKNYEQAEQINAYARNQFAELPLPWVHYAEQAMTSENWELALSRWQEVRNKFPENPAAYQRAAAAADALGNENLARKLRMAKDYGSDWLNEVEDEASRQTIAMPSKRSLKNFTDLVWIKAVFNLKSEASRNKLSYVWWVLEPLLYMMVFYVVFTKLLDRGGEGYVAFLLTGLVPFMWFAKSIQAASGSILGAQGLIQQIKIDPLFFPIVALVQTTLKQIPVFIMLFGFLILYGVQPGWQWLGLLPVMFLQFMIIASGGILLALIVPFLKDLQQVIPTVIQFLLFVSGIFFLADSISPQWQAWFFANPVANLLLQYREILINGHWPHWGMMFQLVVTAMFMFGIVWALYVKLRYLYPKAVME
jgi:lipopolysaccharide transport system permease protein